MATSAIKITYDEGSAPATPAANKVVTYAKSDGLIYSKDDAGVEKLMSVGSGSGTSLNPGTSFPGSPATNDLCFRTDRGLLYFYNGTRWLTVTLYKEEVNSLAGGITTSGTSTIGRISNWHTTYDLWLENWYVGTYVATTNNGSSFWTATLRKYQADFSTSTSLASRSTGTGPDAANSMITAEIAIGALLVPATYKEIQCEVTKTSSPGAISIVSGVSYRLVG